MTALPVLTAHPGCTGCDLHHYADNPGMPGRWVPTSLPPSSTTPLIYFLGQNPGGNEDKQGECFVGQSGRLLLEGMVEPYNLHKKASVYFSNAVRCYTLDNAKPKPKHQKACFPYTREEIAALPCSTLYIVCLGETPLSSLFKMGLLYKKMSLTDAFKLNLERFSFPATPFLPASSFHLVATYHPAYTFRAPNAAIVIDNHIRVLSDHLDGTASTPSSPTIIPVRDPVTR
jgi:uracil-DNA glycosylase family 4